MLYHFGIGVVAFCVVISFFTCFYFFLGILGIVIAVCYIKL